jgi:hypothetical protein
LLNAGQSRRHGVRCALANISGSGTSTGEITYADETKHARTFTGTIICP